MKFEKPEDVSLGGNEFEDQLNVKVVEGENLHFKGVESFGRKIKFVLPTGLTDLTAIAS